MKKIGIDAQLMGGELRGIGRYISSVIFELSKKNLEGYRLYIFTNSKAGYQAVKKLNVNSNLIIIYLPLPQALYEQILLPLCAIKYKLNVFIHSGNTGSIFWLHGKQYALVHDLSYFNDTLKPNSLYRLIGRMYRKYTISRLIPKAEKIFTVSEFAKNEIIRIFNIKENKILITYNGVDDFFYANNRDLINKENSIILVTGTDNQKNLKLIINEFSRSNNLSNELKIIVVGVNDGDIKYDKKLNINFLGYLKQDKLSLLYKKSKIFLVPSLYESFGIPGIEALASGCIVYSSNKGALPEIYGEHAFYFNPECISELSSLIDRINTTKSKTIHEHQIACNFIKKYSWNRVASVIMNEIQTND